MQYLIISWGFNFQIQHVQNFTFTQLSFVYTPCNMIIFFSSESARWCIQPTQSPKRPPDGAYDQHSRQNVHHVLDSDVSGVIYPPII